MIVVEEQELLTTMPSSCVPSFHTLTDDSDKETERYLERILSSVAAESRFAQISPNIEGTGKSLGLEHGGTREMEATTIKDVSASTAGRGEIRTISTADYKSRLRREGSIASQIATDTSPVGGSTSGRTPEAIYWFVSETLNQLGKKWLGNPLTTLIGLILAPTMVKIKAMTSQKIANHMIFHLINVSVLCFNWVVYLISHKLILFPRFAGFHA
jgi:hypothetical protein